MLSTEKTSGHPQIVGLGASAGGLNAFLRIVRLLPPDAGLAYVLVQHLAPEHVSLLPTILDNASTVPVVEAQDGMLLEANCGYVIPPNTTMTVTDGHLRLVDRQKGRAPHYSIDAFFRSLAEVHGSESVAVILSGTGSDGARGIEAIKEAGGITIAQDAESAEFSEMPEASIATGCVDFILTPEDVAEHLGRLGRHLGARGAATPKDGDVTPSSGAVDERDLHKILTLLYRRTGVDFLQYRRGTMHRRILRRMLVHRQESRGEYLAHLRVNPAELDLLYEDLLIGVTSFFRDPEVFADLKEKVFPELMSRRAPNAAIRAWIVGCASGEEAYSFAIALLEFLGDERKATPIQIFASDLSEASIARARAARYPASIASQVSAERLSKYFTQEDGVYRIAKRVRDLCVFSRQNVVRDPPFSHLDIISCRNLLIYLEAPLQRRVFSVFHFALEPHGVLILGSAESAGVASTLFEPSLKRSRVFHRRMTDTQPLAGDFTPSGLPDEMGAGDWRASPIRPPPPGVLPVSPTDVASAADRVLLSRFTPPGVVINESMHVLHFHGDTSRFLAHPAGSANLDLLRLAHAELVPPLRSAVGRASTDHALARESPIALKEGTATTPISIEVLPLSGSSTAEWNYLVLFLEDSTPQSSPATGGRKPRRGRTKSSEDPAALAVSRDELAATRRYLQEIVEQHEVTVEELRATGEELQASNEELQSTNEELETTKEEVQSTNEEVSTVNEELQQRNTELSATSADLANILVNTKVPIAIVDRDLLLRRFTPALSRLMKVIPSDAGRPLTDVRLRFQLPDLERRIAHAVDTLSVDEVDVRDDDGRWWGLTIRPYQTVDRRVDGAVLVFADIDTSKRHAERADEFIEERKHLLGTSEEARRIAEAATIVAQAAQVVAEKANRAKADFLANMSHDLRTPLNAIDGYTELMELGLRGPVTEAQLLDLSRIKRSSRHLLALINDILNFAKVEAVSVTFALADVRVDLLVSAVLDLVDPQLAARSLHVERGTLDGTVRADPERLHQILVNLLTNAIKFTPPSGSINVSSVVAPDAIRIEVTDTGPGIPALQFDHIFEPFVQLDRGYTTPAPDGVGLGLAISRGLARAMHGDLTVASEVGDGSTFVLTLPRAMNGVEHS
ncbi:MAG: chemotaxis protein CheB [Gemmatimonadota bacterium]